MYTFSEFILLIDLFQILFALFLPFLIPLIKFSTSDFEEPPVDVNQEEEDDADVGSKADMNQVSYIYFYVDMKTDMDCFATLDICSH